jgi:exonuclease SbcD
MKFVHAADLHLDSPLRGLERYEGAPVEQIRGATRRALENLVDLCLQEQAALLLLAGDLFDDDWRDYSTGLFFFKEMARLREGGVQVVCVRGNHDAASKITRRLKLPDNVYELSTKKAETRELEKLGVAIHGQGFATREVTSDLSASYPQPVPGALNIGLLHTSVDGRAGHASYAPCRLEALCGRGYQYWALGHVHAREVLSTDPWVVFPGNLQGRHARETGPKGATLVNCGDGCIESVEHRPLDVVRWERCDIDAAEARTADEAIELVREKLERTADKADGRLLAARVALSGATRAHSALSSDPDHWVQQIRAVALDIRAGDVWVERVQIRTQSRVDRSQLAERDDAIGQLVRSLRTLRQDDEALTALLDEFSDLRSKLGDLPRDAGDFGLDGPAGFRAWIDEVEQLLLPRLLSDEDGAP